MKKLAIVLVFLLLLVVLIFAVDRTDDVPPEPSAEIIVECFNTSAGYECNYVNPPSGGFEYSSVIDGEDEKLREKCEADGGKFKCYGFCTPAYARICDFPYNDAGEACTDDDECSGYCLPDEGDCENNCTGTCAQYRLNLCDNPTHLTKGVSYFESAICD